jgi:hypothetical protein
VLPPQADAVQHDRHQEAVKGALIQFLAATREALVRGRCVEWVVLSTQEASCSSRCVT